MGSTLNIAVGKAAYVLSDRATWIKFANKQDFKIHVQGDKRLFNQYGITLINPTKCPSVKSKRRDKNLYVGCCRIKDSHRLNPTRSAAISYSFLTRNNWAAKKIAMVSSVIMAAGSMLQLLPKLLVACPKVDESKFQTVFGPSSSLRDKIENGQRCDLFISAHSTHTDALVKKLKYLVVEQSLG